MSSSDGGLLVLNTGAADGPSTAKAAAMFVDTGRITSLTYIHFRVRVHGRPTGSHRHRRKGDLVEYGRTSDKFVLSRLKN